MKLSCLPVSFFADILEGNMSVREWAEMGAQLGLDAIDLSILFVPNRSLQEVTRLQREIQLAGMQVAMLTTYPDFTHPQAEQRARELSLEIEAVAIAAELGAELVRVTDGQAHPETEVEAGVSWAIEGLTKLVEATQHFSTRLVFENHAKPGAWTYTDFSQSPDIFLRIVEGTAHCGLGINFDTGNAATFSSDPVELLEKVIHRVVSVHAADSATKGVLRHVLLGTGITPFAALFKTLKQVGWNGWICMEEGSNQGRLGVEAAAGYIRQAWSQA